MRKPLLRQNKTLSPSRQNARAVQTSCLDGSYYVNANTVFEGMRLWGYRVIGLYGYEVNIKTLHHITA